MDSDTLPFGLISGGYSCTKQYEWQQLTLRQREQAPRDKPYSGATFNSPVHKPSRTERRSPSFDLVCDYAKGADTHIPVFGGSTTQNKHDQEDQYLSSGKMSIRKEANQSLQRNNSSRDHISGHDRNNYRKRSRNQPSGQKAKRTSQNRFGHHLAGQKAKELITAYDHDQQPKGFCSLREHDRRPYRHRGGSDVLRNDDDRVGNGFCSLREHDRRPYRHRGGSDVLRNDDDRLGNTGTTKEIGHNGTKWNCSNPTNRAQESGGRGRAKRKPEQPFRHISGSSLNKGRRNRTAKQGQKFNPELVTEANLGEITQQKEQSKLTGCPPLTTHPDAMIQTSENSCSDTSKVQTSRIRCSDTGKVDRDQAAASHPYSSVHQKISQNEAIKDVHQKDIEEDCHSCQPLEATSNRQMSERSDSHRTNHGVARPADQTSHFEEEKQFEQPEPNQSTGGNGERNSANGPVISGSDSVPLQRSSTEEEGNTSSFTFKRELGKFITNILNPLHEHGLLSPEIHNIVLSKAVEKVTRTVGPKVPLTETEFCRFLSREGQGVNTLVQRYLNLYLASVKA